MKEETLFRGRRIQGRIEIEKMAMKSRKEKFFAIVGWMGTTMSMAMYVSYIPQIADNLAGHKATPLQPLVAGINCILWISYGLWGKQKVDWPITIANAPGIVFGFVAFATAL